MKYLLCTVILIVAVVELIRELSVDWQVYCPPCEVCRGLNVRTPLDKVIPFPLVTTPFEFLHATTGMSEVSPTILPVQVSVYICPATGLPDIVMLVECTETEVQNIIR